MSRGHFDHHGLRWALGGGGYQFYTTSPTVQWSQSSATDFFPRGSIIQVPSPTLVLKLDGQVDYEKTVIRAIPSGSVVEHSESLNEWPFITLSTSQLSELMAAFYELFPVKNAWQVNGMPEFVYYETQTSSLPPHSIKEPLVKTKSQLHQSWVQQGGQVYGANAHFPLKPRYEVDELYDAAPGKIKKIIEGKAPDTDWFGRACTQVVNGIRFVILHDTEGNWYCWKEGAELDVARYSQEYALYGDQAYKANIIPEQAKKVTPTYPSWVSDPISWRDQYRSSKNTVIFEPRYSFSFNSNGTRAISVMVERRNSACELYETNYTPAGLQAAILAGTPLTSPFLPTEVRVADIKLDASLFYGGFPDERELQEDRRGFVELSLEIDVEGEAFTFSVSVLDSQSPDRLALLNQGALVDVAYARALDWSKLESMGYPLTDSIFSVVTDELLSVWIELYEHQENKEVVDGFDGEPSLNMPSKTKASFYKGYDFSTRLFALPLSQTHGLGYTYAKYESPIILPEPPHLFVWNPSQTFASRYPIETRENTSEALYYYSSTIEHLDLSTLSFYYTTRLLEQTKEDVVAGNFVPIKNKSKTVCTVCVMGRDFDEVEVGNTDLPTTWIWGWRRFAGTAVASENETKVALNRIGNLRGIGHCVNASTRSMAYYTIGVNPWNHTSWVNCPLGSGMISYDFNVMGVHPWWMIGPCGHIVHLALSLGVMNAWYGGEHSFIQSILGNDETVTITYTVPGTLFGMTKEDMPAFGEFIYDLYDNFVGTFSSSGGTQTCTLSDLYSENPFPLANVGIYKETFVEKAKGYLWLLVQDIQRTFPEESPGDEHGSTIYRMIPLDMNFFGSSVFTRGGGMITGLNYNMLVKPTSQENIIKLFERHLAVKNIELGTFYYNQAIQTHFHGQPASREGKILVTPAGHVSYYKKDVFDISSTYSVQELVYTEDYNNTGNLIPTALKLEFLQTPMLTLNDVDWKLVDGLSWYYGMLKTTHLTMYNLAYQDYSQIENRKPYVVHQEVFGDKYAESDFKPDFRVTNYDGFYWIYPLYAEDGKPKDMQYLGVAKESGIHYTAPSVHPSHDPRPMKKSLRLSPLFF